MTFLTLYSPVVTISTGQWSVYVPHSGQYMYRTVVTICTASLTFNNSTFCPHTVFMCFVWISEQPLFPYTTLTDWFFLTETESVYFSVLTGWFVNVTVRSVATVSTVAA